jgi:hypothetical protein
MIGCPAAFTARGDWGDDRKACPVAPMIDSLVMPTGTDVVAAWNRRTASISTGKPFVQHEKAAGAEWWHEFQTEEQRHRYIVESRIWAHYDHARTKHPYFCDTLLSSTLPPTYHEEVLSGTRRMLLTEQSFNQLRALSLLECEEDELKLAISRDDISNAIEEAYDCIAVLLRVIDVLEGRQPLGRPEVKP